MYFDVFGWFLLVAFQFSPIPCGFRGLSGEFAKMRKSPSSLFKTSISLLECHELWLFTPHFQAHPNNIMLIMYPMISPMKFTLYYHNINMMIPLKLYICPMKHISQAGITYEAQGWTWWRQRGHRTCSPPPFLVEIWCLHQLSCGFPLFFVFCVGGHRLLRLLGRSI